MTKDPVSRQCSHVPTCELFPRFSLRASLRIWQLRYCDGAFENCERYRRALRGEPVEPGMLPNGNVLRCVAGTKP